MSPYLINMFHPRASQIVVLKCAASTSPEKLRGVQILPHHPSPTKSITLKVRSSNLSLNKPSRYSDVSCASLDMDRLVLRNEGIPAHPPLSISPMRSTQKILP